MTIIRNNNNFFPHYSTVNLTKKKTIMLSPRYLKTQTAEFFGLDEENESGQRQRWENKRKRLAVKKYGNLKENTSSLSSSLSASAAAGFVNIGGRYVLIPNIMAKPLSN